MDFAHLVVRGAKRMVEYDHPLGAALGFDQLHHLRIVNALDLVLVVKVINFGVVRDKAKAVRLQIEFFRVRTTVVNFDAAWIWRAAGARIAAAGAGDDGKYFAAVIHDVVKRGFDCVRGNVEFGGLAHGALPGFR